MSRLAGFIWQERQQREQPLALRIRRTNKAKTRVLVVKERELRNQDGV